MCDLLKWGFEPNYKHWEYHGESLCDSSFDNDDDFEVDDNVLGGNSEGNDDAQTYFMLHDMHQSLNIDKDNELEELEKPTNSDTDTDDNEEEYQTDENDNNEDEDSDDTFHIDGANLEHTKEVILDIARRLYRSHRCRLHQHFKQFETIEMALEHKPHDLSTED
ncbi:hypothetical protein Fmac_014568 [Flemingia macrophylla]|uniref:Transposase n=1 Tax=Flemingia macrophylla TaxID=520843 RepID=A0ABD1MC32_9FABA